MKSTTDFEKDYFKLLNNSYYGKTCENIRNRVDIQLVSNREKALKLHSNPRFKNEIRFDKNLAAILKNRTHLKFDKPIYIGATVLEVSKLLMYDFYYNVLQPYFGEKNIELLYLDTDSFILSIQTKDITHDLEQLKEHFDFSNYPKDHKLFSNKYKKIPGKFKDELGGEEMIEFAALKSKMYSYRTKDSETKKCKGITKHVVKKSITFDDYLKSLFNEETFHHQMNTLSSTKHEMYIQQVYKVSLDPYDDKRYIKEDGIETLPYGNPDIRSSE